MSKKSFVVMFINCFSEMSYILCLSSKPEILRKIYENLESSNTDHFSIRHFEVS